MFSPTVIDVSAICVAVFIFLAMLVSIFGIHKLYQHREDVFLQKRSKSVLHAVFGLNMASILGMCASLGTIYARFTLTKGKAAGKVFHAAKYCSWFLIMLFLNVKNFRLLFRFKWQHFALQSEWQRIIDPNIVQELHQTNWYIRNKRSWGHLPTVYLYFGLFHGLNFAICYSLHLYISNVLIPNYENDGDGSNEGIAIMVLEICFTVLLILPFIIYILIEIKTPNFHDTFYMHLESRIEAILAAVLFGVLISSTIVQCVRGTLTVIDVLIFTTLRAVVQLGVVLVSTLLVIHKNEKRSKRKKGEARESDIQRWQQSVRITLNQVLSNAQALNALMMHLSKEYSMELLLSYIEIDQFQKYVLQIADDNLNSLIVQSSSLTNTCSAVESICDLRDSTNSNVMKVNQTLNIGRNLTGAEQDFFLQSLFTCLTTKDNGPGINQRVGLNDMERCVQISLNIMPSMHNVPISRILRDNCLKKHPATSTTTGSPGGIHSVNENTMIGIKTKAHLLYIKYVKAGCQFEINIPHLMRDRMQKQFGDLEALLQNESLQLYDFIVKFDRPKQEMWQLLNFSFIRMQNTDAFRKLMMHFPRHEIHLSQAEKAICLE